ncbi:MAG: restriction endonuclease subunit R, partial [Gemmatimonadetes bacterium]|nr:restriction endonuclease subunit R [Gemmatimonadota bacterium]
GKVQEAIAVYSSDELDTEPGNGGANNVELKNWLVEGRTRLEAAREALSYLCEPVPLPREVEQYLRYFCGNAADPEALDSTEPLRVEFYKSTAGFLRAYAAIAQELEAAGYSAAQVTKLREEVAVYADLRAAVKRHSGEELDIKPYEADMRHLLNTYLQADPATTQGELDTVPLTQLIVETGVHDAIARKLNAKGMLSRNAVAEAIVNNVRKTIIRDQLTDPRFYEQMSRLLEDLIAQSRADAAAYEEFLRKAEELVRRLASKEGGEAIPDALHGVPEATVLYRNLDSLPGTTFRYPTPEEARAELALRIHARIKEHAPAGWRGDQARESQVKNVLYPLLDRDPEATMALFEIVKNQPGY